MEQEQSQSKKTLIAVLVIILILGAGFVWFGDALIPDANNADPEVAGNAGVENMAVVENTPVVNGMISLPTGFPPDVPVEELALVESATTKYPAQNAKQLSLSYKSDKTVSEKYAEYKTYMSEAGYTLTEGDANAPVKALFGTKADVNLTVVVSSIEGGSLVQLSYLIKSASN